MGFETINVCTIVHRCELISRTVDVKYMFTLLHLNSSFVIRQKI